MSNIAIIGSGSWGTALAIHLNKIGHNIKIWSYSKEEADLINNEHLCKFLPKVTLSEKIVCFTSIEETLKNSEIILLVTPAKVVRETVAKMKPYITNQIIVVCSKGIEEDTLLTLDDVVKEVLGDVNVAALSGPTHAEEVAIGMPTAIVAASENEEVRNRLQDEFSSENFRVYTNSDVKGVELRRCYKKRYSYLCWYCCRLWLWGQCICSFNIERSSRNSKTWCENGSAKRYVLWFDRNRRFNCNMFKSAQQKQKSRIFNRQR